MDIYTKEELSEKFRSAILTIGFIILVYIGLILYCLKNDYDDLLIASATGLISFSVIIIAYFKTRGEMKKKFNKLELNTDEAGLYQNLSIMTFLKDLNKKPDKDVNQNMNQLKILMYKYTINEPRKAVFYMFFLSIMAALIFWLD